MKWFKHYSDSLDDPFIHALMDEFGHFGYAVWFGLIEIIAKENGNTITGKLSISPTYLRRKLRTTLTKLRQVFDYCQTNARLTVNYSEKEWDFDFPKMAQIKDNYTKDLQETGKKPSNHKEVEEEKEKEEEKNIKKVVFDFESIWNKYPLKDGKKYAKKHFTATVRTQEDWENINRALGNYIKHLEATSWKQPKNGSTWFNNWQDWVEWDEPEIMTMTEEERRDAQKKVAKNKIDADVEQYGIRRKEVRTRLAKEKGIPLSDVNHKDIEQVMKSEALT